MKRFPIEILFFAILWPALMVGGRSSLLRDPGTFWHQVVGDQMFQNRQLLWTDPYTFTHHGDHWIPYQWLAEIGMGLLNRIGGLDSLLVTAVTIIAALYAWLGGRLVRRGGLHPAVAGMVLAFSVFAGSSHFHVRPHLLTLVGIGWTYALLSSVEGGRRPVKQLFWLVPLFVLWTNLHGGVLGGLASLFLVSAGWIVFRREFRKQALLLVALCIACTATIFVTPFGTALSGTWKTIMSSPALPRLIKEHAPPQWDEISTWGIVAFGVIYAILLLGVPRKEVRIVWLLPLVWFAMGMSRVRHAPLFSVVALLAIADFFPKTFWAKRLVEKKSDWFIPPVEPIPHAKPFWLLVPVVLLIICLGTQAKNIEVPVVGRGWAQLDRLLWPTELDPELSQIEAASEQPIPIFNEFIQGGYLIRYHPKFRVFIDDRCELYSDKFLTDFVEIRPEEVAGRMKEWESRYGRFQYALTQIDSPYEHYFSTSEQWELIQRAPAASLYRRK